jgi:hypothetical protein
MSSAEGDEKNLRQRAASLSEYQKRRVREAARRCKFALIELRGEDARWHEVARMWVRRVP